ncbi:DUF1232 domain-containing protein [Luteimonas saliphila]|uniref:DUF1232 domain-containing protein n=1 Tax=Luteimonas saliphila TaxID=2804919 RepID=UPI00192D2343|nr:DUF1232 domain-containing protein [Luteimonas saliphila]
MNVFVDTPDTVPAQPLAPFEPQFHQIGTHPAGPDAFDRFNRVLSRVGGAPLEPADLASAARRLARPARTGRPSDWIVRRLRRGLAAGLMLADPSWEPAPQCGQVASTVVAYLQSVDDLIPDDVPVYGRLDDALVVEVAWPALAAEMRSYLDFCRVRRMEAALRGCGEADFVFGRREWDLARNAEAGLLVHRREAGLRSYLPSPSPMPYFRVC